MPKVPKYVKGFDIYVGDTFANYKIVDLSIEHKEIVRFKSYRYPTTIDFKYQGKGKPDPQKLLQSLKEHLSGEKTIYTSYGNPYACHFFSLKDLKITSSSEDDREIEIKAEGHCERIHKNQKGSTSGSS